MAGTFLFTLSILICSQVIFVDSTDVTRQQQPVRKQQQSIYWQRRQQLIYFEKRQSLGGELELNPTEVKANQVLMRAKNREIYNGFTTGNSFLPSQNFMDAKWEIEKSEVFKILRDMPKGGILHAHDTAIASLDYRLNDLTYRKNLYVCDKKDDLKLMFFKTPNKDCDWKLLSKVRQNAAQASDINERLKKSLSMLTKNPKSVYTTVNKAWEKFDSIFNFMWPLVAYWPNYEDLYYRNLQELYEDNVMYAEIRSGLSSKYDIDGKSYGPLEIVQLHKNVTERFMKDHPDFIGVKIIYSPHRGIDPNRLDSYLKTMVEIKKLYPDQVAGFDLVGQEDKGKHLTEFANKLNAADPSIQFFFHAGETNWNGASTDLNLFDAFLLNTKRIGHGYALTKHPLLWKFAKQLNIAVEVCPISNQVLGLVEDMRNHPAASLFATGSPVVVSSDDPALWGAKGLTYDFYEAFMGMMNADSDIRSLKQLAMNSLIYSSMNKQEQQKALSKWQVKWDAYVTKLARSA